MIDTQLAILNLQAWCYKWRISINTLKTTYMFFYDKKQLPAPPSIPLTIDGSSLKRVTCQRILGILIDEDLTFTPHIENITNKCKKAYNRLTLFPNIRPDLALQIFKSFIRSKLEYGSIIWGHTIYKNNHIKLLEAAQKGALMLILRAMKSTPTDALESELNILPIDLRLEELQRIEAIKLLQKNDPFINDNMQKTIKGKKLTPLTHLGHLVKQILVHLSKHQKISLDSVQIPPEIPPTMETFSLQNLTVKLPNKFVSTHDEKKYIKEITDNINTNKTMLVFTDGSAQGNPGPTGSGVVIRRPGQYKTPIKETKAVTSCGTSYEGEIKAIELGTSLALKNINKNKTTSILIYSDSQSAIKAVMAQNRDSYHNTTIRKIRDNLIQLSSLVSEIQIIYCPAHKGIEDNEIADSLAKVASKKASHLPPRTDLSIPKIKELNKTITLGKWNMRWVNSKFHRYKQYIPTLCKKSLKHRSLHLKYTTRKVSSKILRLKTGHCMLNYHKSKIDLETNPKCDICKVNETPTHYLLECGKYDTQRAHLIKQISPILSKNGHIPQNLSLQLLLGEHNFNSDDSELIRAEIGNYFMTTKQEI